MFLHNSQNPSNHCQCLMAAQLTPLFSHLSSKFTVAVAMSLTTTRYESDGTQVEYEMKADVGMSLHEKGRNKKMPTPRHKVTHNPIPTSLFCFNMLFVCLFVCLL